MSFIIKQWRSNDNLENYHYEEISTTEITVGVTEVNGWFILSDGNYIPATGLAQAGITYYRNGFDILAGLGLTSVNKLGIQAPFLSKFTLEINGGNSIEISIGYSGFYELDNDLISVTKLKLAESNTHWFNIIVDAIGKVE